MVYVEPSARAKMQMVRLHPSLLFPWLCLHAIRTKRTEPFRSRLHGFPLVFVGTNTTETMTPKVRDKLKLVYAAACV